MSDETRMPSESEPPSPRPDHAARRPLARAIAVTLGVTLLSYVLPLEHAATGVGLAFLAATYFCALRSNDPDAARHFGLSLGGLLDPEPLGASRLVADAGKALGWAVAVAVVILPPFWAGYVLWWSPSQSFDPGGLPTIDDVLGQLLVIALPEEAFYRGYLQTALDDAWPPKHRVLGARVGAGLLVASVLFALGHFATLVHPSRLAVFFPSLLFGWLRAKTGGIGSSVAFHATCNLFASFLARSYGLSP